MQRREQYSALPMRHVSTKSRPQSAQALVRNRRTRASPAGQSSASATRSAFGGVMSRLPRYQ